MKRLAAALIWIAVAATSAWAVQPDEVLKDPQLEARARLLSEGFRCLVCQNQSIDESDASLARDLRILIRERLTAGDSDQQITDFVVARYGEFVLLKPRFNARTWALWLTPFALVGIGLVAFSRRRPTSAAAAEAQLSEEEVARLRELNR
jgi:cytochrome c-type biogenesis protein CcmH